MIVARQFIAWNSSIENPSRRARSDPYPRLINRPDRSTPIGPNHTVPYGTVPLFAPIPGNKLPGYHQLVPTGQPSKEGSEAPSPISSSLLPPHVRR